MDETSVYIDFPSTYTYEECGAKRVKAVTAGQEKTRLSAAFTATASGIKNLAENFFYNFFKSYKL